MAAAKKHATGSRILTKFGFYIRKEEHAMHEAIWLCCIVGNTCTTNHCNDH